MVRIALILSLAWVVVALADPAHARHCEPTDGRIESDEAWSATVQVEAASYSHHGVAGSWLGVRPGFGVGGERWLVHGWVPVYRLDRPGHVSEGVGDAGLDGRVVAWRSTTGRISLGPQLAVTFPTGAASSDLGMGHAMAMAGGWWAARRGSSTALGIVSYGRALTHVSHAHHPTPVVDPMNPSELLLGAAMNFRLSHRWRAHASATFAQPIASSGGERRSAAGAGAGFVAGPVEVRASAEVPLVGSAFRLRTLFSTTLRM